METQPQVFISYCRDDAEAANRVCAFLEEQGLACWIAPRNIPPGQEWPVAIPAAIRRSSSLVLLLSSHSGASRQIGREVEIADRNLVPIISFRLEDVDPPEALEYFLNNRQWVDGFGARFDSGTETLVNALRNTPAPIRPKSVPSPSSTRSEYKRLGVSLFIALVLTFVLQALEYYGWFSGPDGRILNALLTGGTKTAGKADDAVAVLEIDNDAYQSKACFNSTSPLNPALVMSLVRESLAAGPRVVGVDIFTEADLYRSMTFAAGDPAVIWMSGAESNSVIRVPNLPQWLLGYHDRIVVKPTKVLGYDAGTLAEHREIHWGVPAFPPDDDFTIRRFPRRIGVSSDPAGSSLWESYPSWAAQVAQEYCRGPADCTGDAAEEIYVSYSGRPPEELKMLDYFVCGAGETLTLSTDKAADFKARIGGKALLIGGTFRPPGPADFHETPRHQLAGVVINAYAVRAEIEGSGLHDIRQPQAWVLDFAIGVVIVLIFHHPLFEFVTSGKGLLRLREFEVRCKIIASFALLLGFYALIRWGWPGVPYLTGFTGVGLGVLIHQISEMFLENPKYREKASTRE